MAEEEDAVGVDGGERGGEPGHIGGIDGVAGVGIVGPELVLVVGELGADEHHAPLVVAEHRDAVAGQVAGDGLEEAHSLAVGAGEVLIEVVGAGAVDQDHQRV